ncbi:AlpA family phage regulatory protein [Novosphingobium sp. NRRL B-2648]
MLRLPAVLERMGMSRGTLYTKMEATTFPAALSDIGALQCVGRK